MLGIAQFRVFIPGIAWQMIIFVYAPGVKLVKIKQSLAPVSGSALLWCYAAKAFLWLKRGTA